MTSLDWRQLVRTVAPALGTALGGPLGGIAAAAVAQALGVTVPRGATAEAVTRTIERAVQSAGMTPEQVSALKRAELEFQARLQELGIRLEEIDAQDRSSAREREAAVRDRTPQILALSVLAIWFVVQLILLFHVVPEGQRDLVMRMLGTLDAALTGAFWYYLGSSRGSAIKTDAMVDAFGKR